MILQLSSLTSIITIKIKNASIRYSVKPTDVTNLLQLCKNGSFCTYNVIIEIQYVGITMHIPKKCATLDNKCIPYL